MSDRKLHFLGQLKERYTKAIAGAHRAETREAEAADALRRDARQREDARSAVQSGRLATGHRRRRQRAIRELETLIAFAEGGVRDFAPEDAVALGALVDVRVETDEGEEERTLFVLPVGAGNELTGPGGDGFVFVVTPESPVGHALLGARAGDVVEVVIEGRGREWELVEIC